MKHGAEAVLSPETTKFARIDELRVLNTLTPDECIKRINLLVTNNTLTLADLSYKIPEGPTKDHTILNLLTIDAGRGNQDAFMAVWHKFKDELSFDHFQSCLYWQRFAIAARSGKSQPFMAIWQKFKDNLTIEFLTKPQHNQPTLMLLIGIPSLQKYLKESVTEMPGYFTNEAVINRLIELKIATPELIPARNKYFKALEEAKAKDTVENEFESLLDLAKTAEEAGYINAYYHMAQYFKMKQNDMKALSIFKLMSPTSPKYQDICLWSANKGLELGSPESIRTAFEFALKISDESVRTDLIQKISSFYVSGDTAHTLITEEKWGLFNEASDISACFSYFDVLKKLNTQQAEIAKLNAVLNPRGLK